MRLNLILPKVEPNQFEFPKKCPWEGCSGMRFLPRQEVSKKIVDAQHPEVTAWRCECKKCGYVFRDYPKRNDPLRAPARPATPEKNVSSLCQRPQAKLRQKIRSPTIYQFWNSHAKFCKGYANAQHQRRRAAPSAACCG